MKLFSIVAVLLLSFTAGAFSLSASVLASFRSPPNPIEDIIVKCLSQLIRSSLKDSEQGVAIEYEAWDEHEGPALRATVNKLLINISGIPINPSSNELYILLVDSEAALRLHVESEGFGKSVNTKERKLLVVYLTPLLGHRLKNSLKRIFDVIFDLYLLDGTVMVPETGGRSVHFYTYHPYLSGRCKSTQPILIHTYEDKPWHRSPTLSQLFPIKNYNFNGCPLKVATMVTPPFITFSGDDRTLDTMNGFDAVILREIARKLNFSIDLHIHNKRGDISGDGNATGIFKYIVDRQANVTMGGRSCNLIRKQVLSASMPYTQGYLSIFFKSDHNYAPFGLIFYPLRLDMWLILACLMVGRCAVVFLVRRRLERLLPQTFRRFLVAMWLLLMMAIRNGYESYFYVYLKNQPVAKMPANIDDMRREGYQIFVTTNALQFLHNFNELDDMLIRDESEHAATKDMLGRDGIKIGFLSKGLYFNDLLGKSPNVRSTVYMLDEPMAIDLLCIYFPPGSYLEPPFDGVIGRLKASGLTNKLKNVFLKSHFKQGASHRYFKRHSKVVAPLKLAAFSQFYQLFMTFHLLALIVLCCELASLRWAALRRLIATFE